MSLNTSHKSKDSSNRVIGNVKQVARDKADNEPQLTHSTPISLWTAEARTSIKAF